MATSITVTKKVPAGTATQVFTTGASESASMTFSVFGQQSTANVDIKILPSSYSIPQDRFDATNFSKTAHPGGTIDTSIYTKTYSETIGGTVYSYLVYDGTFDSGTGSVQIRRQDNSTKLYGSTYTIYPQAACRYTDNQRGVMLDNYYTTPVTIRSVTAGAVNPHNRQSNYSSSGSWSPSYYNGGVWVNAANGFGVGITTSNGYFNYTFDCSTNYTITTTASYYASPRAWFVANIGTSYQYNVFGYGNYVFCCACTNGGPFYTISAPISGFTTTPSTNPGWANQANATNPIYVTTSSAALAADARMHTDAFGKVFIPVTSGNFGTTTDMLLFRIAPNGTNGTATMSSIYHPTPGTYGYTVDMSYAPFIDYTNSRVVFKCGIVYSQTRFFSVDTNGTTYDYGATHPLLSTAWSRPYNAKTLSVNYANYNQFKFTDGISDSDGLAYYTDGSGSYSTNGQSFWCKEGKYTLIRDESLTKLNAVSTDDYWFDRQFSASKGVRVEYTGITLAPAQSFWITSPVDIQILAFGFKE